MRVYFPRMRLFLSLYRIHLLVFSFAVICSHYDIVFTHEVFYFQCSTVSILEKMWNVGKLIERSKLRCIFHQSTPNCIHFLSDAIVRAVRKHSLGRTWKFDISRSGPSAFRLEIRDSNSSFMGICDFCSKPISFEFLESSAIITSQKQSFSYVLRCGFPFPLVFFVGAS